MKNHTQSEASEMRCFGCTVAHMQWSLERQAMLGGWSMLLMSMMSDVQELVARGNAEEARTLLNQCKWVLSTYVAPKDAEGRLL